MPTGAGSIIELRRIRSKGCYFYVIVICDTPLSVVAWAKPTHRPRFLAKLLHHFGKHSYFVFAVADLDDEPLPSSLAKLGEARKDFDTELGGVCIFCKEPTNEKALELLNQ